MALTLRRWALLLILAGAIVSVALLPAPPYGSRLTVRRHTDPSRAIQLAGQLGRAKDELETARIKEGIVGALAGRRYEPGPFLIEIGSSTSEQRRAFMETLLAWWPRLTIADSIAVAVVLGGDSASPTWQPQYMFPASTDQRTCVTIVPTTTWLPRGGFGGYPQERRLISALSPCLLLAQHGKPGPAIERWFETRGPDFAAWFNPRSRRPGDLSAQREDGADLAAVFQLEWYDLARLPSGLECLNGVTESCVTGVFNEATDAAVLRPGIRTPTEPWRAPFGPLTESFLADLREEIGPDRFSRFWKSDQPLPQAFQEAVGQDLGSWVQGWVQKNFGRYEPGPAPSGSEAIRIAGISLLLLGCAVVVGIRRTVDR